MKFLNVTIKYQSNPLKSTRNTRHPYDPISEQTEDVNGQNWVQIKMLRFLSVWQFSAWTRLNPTDAQP
jgi:hypothetical protein